MRVLTADEAEKALGQLRTVSRQHEAERAMLDHEQAVLDEKRLATLRPIEQRKAELAEAVLAWVASEPWPSQARSRVLAHGAVGMRRTSGRLVFVRGEAHTLAAAKVRGQDQLIVHSEALDKTALRRLDLQEQQLLGVRVEARDVAFLRLPEGEQFSAEEGS